jgi:hypothetical protein
MPAWDQLGSDNIFDWLQYTWWFVMQVHLLFMFFVKVKEAEWPDLATWNTGQLL